jgi:hypothetical protein
MYRFTVNSCLRQSISGSAVKEILEPLFSMLISRMNFAVSSFVNAEVSPLAMMEFELGLTEISREFLRAILQAVLNCLESGSSSHCQRTPCRKMSGNRLSCL